MSFSGCLEGPLLYAHIEYMIETFKARGIEDALKKGPVLDVGTANADVPNMLRFYYPDAILIGLDYKLDWLRGADGLANFELLSLVNATAESLPFADRSIRVLHTCFLSGSLDGFTENFSWDRFLEEVDRVLMPGAFYLISEPGYGYGYPLTVKGYEIITGHDGPGHGAVLQKPLKKVNFK